MSSIFGVLSRVRSSFIIEDTMIEDLYELIGGRSTIEAATERFYGKVLRDESLRHFFEGVDMAQLRSAQCTSPNMWPVSWSASL